MSVAVALINERRKRHKPCFAIVQFTKRRIRLAAKNYRHQIKLTIVLITIEMNYFFFIFNWNGLE